MIVTFKMCEYGARLTHCANDVISPHLNFSACLFIPWQTVKQAKENSRWSSPTTTVFSNIWASANLFKLVLRNANLTKTFS